MIMKQNDRTKNSQFDINRIEIPYKPFQGFESEACQKCANNPRNGGSGICHCTLGLPKVKC